MSALDVRALTVAAGRLLRRRHVKLADYVPYLLTMPGGENETVLTRAGGLLRVARIEAPDLETASPAALLSHDDRMSELWGRLDSGVTVVTDQWRFKAPQYLPPSDFGGCWAAKAVDESRRRLFEGRDDPVFTNTAFVSVHQVPPQRDTLLRWMRGDTRSAMAGIVKGFEQNANAFFRELSLSMRGCDLLTGDALASYLHGVANFRIQPKVTMPKGVLAHQLAASLWQTVPSLSIDNRHIATVEVISPEAPFPDTMQELHQLPFECRWVTTFHALTIEEQRAEIVAARKAWRAKQKKLASYVAEWWTKNPFAGRTEPEADAALLELDQLEANLRKEPFGFAHCNLHVWDETASGALDKAEIALAAMRDAGLVARIADLNAFGAAIGDMPGNVAAGKRNERRPRMAVRAAVRLSPLTGVSSGSKVDKRFGGPALLVGRSRRGVPFWWSMNAPGSQDAHTIVVGKTGGGKSALLAFMAMQFLRYPDAKVIFVDRYGSFMVPCLAMGGEWIELGDGGTGVQPLRAVDRPEEFAWAHAWVCRALSLRGVTITSGIAGEVTDALREVAGCDPDDRTLTRLLTYLSGSEEARQGLAYWCQQGPFGHGFDGVVRGYGAGASVIGAETARVAGLGDAEPMMLLAFFRALERDVLSASGPKLLMLDEAWAYLASEVFRPQVESWARELRKRHTALVLATQDPADLSHDVGRVVQGQSGNRIWCPHPEAMKPELRRAYLAAGLSEEQVRSLTTARPQCDYLLQTQGADRWMSLRLEDEAAAYCGAGVGLAHERARALRAEGHAAGEPFARAWNSETTAEWDARRNLPEWEKAA